MELLYVKMGRISFLLLTRNKHCTKLKNSNGLQNASYLLSDQTANGLNFPIRQCAIVFLDSVLRTFVWCNRS